MAMDEETDGKLKFETSKEVEVLGTFDGMGLREDLLRGLYAYGENTPAAPRACNSPHPPQTRQLIRSCVQRHLPCRCAGLEKPSAIQQRAIVPMIKGWALPKAGPAVLRVATRLARRLPPLTHRPTHAHTHTRRFACRSRSPVEPASGAT